MVVRSTGSIFGVLLLIEDLEILVYDFLVGRLRCGLLGFVVWGDGWFLRVEELAIMEAGSWASCVPFGGGSDSRNPGTTTSIKANRESLALMTFFGLWKRLVEGLYPRMKWVAWSWPSLCRKIYDLRIQFKSLKFTRCLARAVWYSSAKENNKNHEIKKKKFILIKSGNILCTSNGPREPYLVPLLGWDNAVHRANLSRR